VKNTCRAGFIPLKATGPAGQIARPRSAVRTVLFDLDGTLADTAPELAQALNTVLQEQGRPPLPFERIRATVSHGTPGLLGVGFGLAPGEPGFAPLRQRLLDIYYSGLGLATPLFPGMPELLAALESCGLNWGVVTNKPAWLTDPLMQRLGLASRAACIVSGDTLPQRKPDPAPLLHACRLAGSRAAECIYVGDAARDVQAGRQAGMRTVLALYGYLGEMDAPEHWEADALIRHPLEVLEWLEWLNRGS
jgi:2-phosphoglycolate phosphatase